MSLRILHWLKEEILQLGPAIIYFFICFSLLHFAQTLLLHPHPVHYTTYLGAIIGAVCAGKVIFIAQHVSLINSFVQKPLIYNIPWKFFIYAFFVIFIQIIEHFLRKFHATDDWTGSYKHVVSDLSHPNFWGLQILILMIFFIFTVFQELTQAIGKKQIKKLFFGLD